MDLDEVLSQRESINTRLLAAIDHATGPWGVKATRIEIKDLIPPPDITQAMARQMKAERERRAVIIEADGEKQSAMTRAEGAKAAAILQAEAGARRLPRRGGPRAPGRGRGPRHPVVSDAIANGDTNAINYFVAQRYVDAFAQLANSPNQKLLIVPAELGSLAGSLAGIKELIGSVGNSEAQPPRPAAPRPRGLEAPRPVDAPMALTPPAMAVPPTPERA
jgi:regulator of protease activity HflC (stomatin/prohibitin superfamily)